MKKINIFDIKKKLSNTNIQCINEVYRHPNLKMDFYCNKGHKFTTTWSFLRDFIKKNKECPYCKYGENYFEKLENKRIELRKLKETTSIQKIYPPTYHDKIIEEFCKENEEYQRYKFRKSIIETITTEEWDKQEEYNKEVGSEDITKEECKELIKDEICDIISMIPDSYTINKYKRTIEAVELENEHRLSINKIIKYSMLNDALHWLYDWTLKLIVIDRFKNYLGIINLPMYFTAHTSSIEYETENPTIDLNYIKSLLDTIEIFEQKIQHEGLNTDYWKPILYISPYREKIYSDFYNIVIKNKAPEEKDFITNVLIEFLQQKEINNICLLHILYVYNLYDNSWLLEQDGVFKTNYFPEDKKIKSYHSTTCVFN